MAELLPVEGQPFELDQLIWLIAVFGSSEKKYHLSVKTVAAQANSGKWYNFGTTMYVNAGEPGQDQNISVGGAALIAHNYEITEVNSVDDLRRILAQWRLDLGQPSGFSFQPRSTFSRVPSRNSFMRSPCWLFELREQADDLNMYQTVSGPFSSPSHNLFAEDIGHLAADWLRYPEMSQRSGSISHQYVVFVPDARAELESLVAEGNDLTVRVISDSASLFCGAVSTGFRGDVHRQIVPFDGNAAILKFSGAVKTLRLWVLDNIGRWLDRYSETESGSSWGRGLYQPQPVHDQTAISLTAALDSGETNKVEFKPYVKAARADFKCEEVLQSIIAFANTNGGDIFIGVNDRGEIEGVDRGIKSDYASQCKGDGSCMEDSYVKDLKKVVAEGIDPAPSTAFDWISFSTFRVLRISVGQSPNKPYTLVANGNIYMRTGATNRSIRRSDIERIFGRIGSGV